MIRKATTVLSVVAVAASLAAPGALAAKSHGKHHAKTPTHMTKKSHHKGAKKK